MTYKKLLDDASLPDARASLDDLAALTGRPQAVGGAAATVVAAAAVTVAVVRAQVEGADLEACHGAASPASSVAVGGAVASAAAAALVPSADLHGAG